MPKKYSVIISAIIFIACYGCNNQQAKENNTLSTASANTTAAIHIDSVSYHQQYGDCGQQDSPCVKISVEYPVIKGGNNNVDDSVNQHIHRQVIKMLEEQATITSDSIKPLADNFIQQFTAFNKKFPLAGGGQWFLQINGNVMNQTAKIISVGITDFSFAGGAHPNTYELWLNYNLQNGQLLHLTDVVTDTMRVMQLAEAKFRAIHHIKPGNSLNDAGFMFTKDKFFLPANFIAYPDSLQFLYNNYEIAAYVYGPQKVTITSGELENLYQKNKLQ